MNAEITQPEQILFNGTLPGAVGNVASILGAEDIARHKQRTIDIYTFFTEENKEILQLNLDHTTRTFLVGVPTSSKVRLLHCIGVGATAIGQRPSAIDGKLLFFHGDGGQDIGTPLPIVLPQSILTKIEVLSMTQEQFHTNLTAQGATYSWPLVPRIRAYEANNKHTIMQIAPIPAFLVLDGIHQDLDAAEVLERVLSLDNHAEETFAHLKRFLLACLTGHNMGDASPRISQAILFDPPAADARRWATAKFKESYPTLVVEPPSAVPTTNAGLTGHPDMAALLTQLLAERAQGQSMGEEKKDDEENTSKNPLGMSNLELAATIKMCGLPPNADTDLLPAWFRQCSEKGMTTTYQCTVVRNHISKHFRYEDAEVPITNNILKMAIKRNWTGKEGNISAPSFTNSNEGLSPFLMVDLTEDEVAQVNDEDEALTTASNVTMAEIKAAKHKLKAAVPESAEKFVTMLLCYANLLYALFGGDCPLFKSIAQIISAFKSYSRNARENFSKLTKASILWVILKQSRQFSIGEMDILGEFKTMYEHLNGKLCSYHHAETPKILYETDIKKRKANNDPNDKDQKLIKRDNPNTWHPKLKEALGEQIKAMHYPTFSAIMRYCGTNASDVYHIHSKKCAPNAFFGRCTKGKECTKDHSLPKTTDVEKILELTKKFREDPSGITRG
jgi:hypothetical protein